MGKKAAKRKSKGKGVGTSTHPMDVTGMEEAMRGKKYSQRQTSILKGERIGK